MKKTIFSLAIGMVLSGGLASCAQKAEKEETAMEEAVDPAGTEAGDPVDADPLANNPAFKIVDNAIFNENVPVVVDFYADWCGPCKQYAPTFHAVAEKYDQGACFVSINVDDYPELAKTYEVSSIPATVFIQPGGGVLGKEVGVITETQLTSWVNQLLATSAGDDMEI